MRKSVVLLSFLLLLAAPVISGASTVAYSNLGPGDSYINWGTWFGTMAGNDKNGSPYSFTYEAGAQFTSSATGTLSNLALGMFHSSGNNNVTLSLSSDAAGTIGSTLWSATYSNNLPGFDDAYYLSGLNGPMLTAGSTYWLRASTDSASMQIWEGNNQAIGGKMGRKEDGKWYYWDTTADAIAYTYAMRVEVDPAAPVPEPGTMLLLGSGLVGLVGYGRKRVRR